MNSETIRDYLNRADMNDAQAQALSRVFAEMATKSDLIELEGRLRAQLATLREDIAKQRADIPWKIIAIVGFFATASTVLNLWAG